MSYVSVGTLTEIHRYPVKSMGGESLQTGGIESYGLYGDRCYAMIDETEQGWERYVTARQIPKLLAYQAELHGTGALDQFPPVRVTSPDGRVLFWNEQLVREFQSHFSKTLSLTSFLPESQDLLAVDVASVLIMTESGLRHLEVLWGKSLDQRRFRANLIVSLDDESFDESQWIGKRLSLGEAVLQVDMACERCSMITIDPDTLETDSSLLRKVNEEMSLHFGVYASVITTGPIAVGQKVYVTD